jgi:hypothetical protein
VELIMSATKRTDALQAAARENAELRRELARLRAETEHFNRTRRRVTTGTRRAQAERMERVRVMLCDQHSRNP